MNLPNSEGHLDKRKILQECQDLRLSIPNLRQMRVSNPCPTFIDFLLQLHNSLEELSILVHEIPMAQYHKAREIIKFNEMFDKMEESNIWEVLPKLRVLEVVFLSESLDLHKGWSPVLRPLKYLYEKCLKSGTVNKTKLNKTEFQWKVIFSKSPQVRRLTHLLAPCNRIF